MFEGSGRISDKKIKIIPKFNFGYSSSGGSHFGINLNFNDYQQDVFNSNKAQAFF